MTQGWSRIAGKIAGGGVFLCAAAACGPNFQASANRLRAQTIAQQNEIGDLQAKVTSRDAIIQGLQAEVDKQHPAVATLSNDRLAQLFTVGRLEIQPSTNFSDLGEGVHGFRVFIRTMTDDGMVFPATGTLTIEAFVLAAAPAAPVRLGTWTFSAADMKKRWYGGFGLNHFAFDCPVKGSAPQGDLVIKVTFDDALTGRHLEAVLTRKRR